MRIRQGAFREVWWWLLAAFVAAVIAQALPSCAQAAEHECKRPKLVIWTSPGCFHCRRFWSDLDKVDGFRAALEQAWCIHVADPAKLPERAENEGITGIPAFAGIGKAPVIGYRTPADLMERLRKAPERDSVVPITEAPAPPPETVTEPIRGPPEPQIDLAPVLEMLESIRDKQETLPTGTEIESITGSAVAPVLRDLAETGKTLGGPLESILGGLEGLSASSAAPAALSMGNLLALAGVSVGTGGTGMAVILALKALMGIISRKRRNQPTNAGILAKLGDIEGLLHRARGGRGGVEAAITPAASPAVLPGAGDITQGGGGVVSAAPPPQPRPVSVNYTPVDTNVTADAFEWAADQFGRKYPGSTGNVEVLRDLMNQYIESMRVKT